MAQTLFRYSGLGLAGMLLASCGGAVSPEVSELGDQPVECALAGAQDFEAVCYFEPADDPGDTRRVILHPDGGFRVFDQAETYSGFATGDGALPAVEEVVGDKVIVSVGPDRYRFDMPVTGE